MEKKKFYGNVKNNMDFNNTKIDWLQVDEVIKSSSRIMLTTHENPDGDGLGAQSGIFYHLQEIQKEVRIVNYSPLPSEYDFLNSDKIFEMYNEEKDENWIKDVDLVIVFDVGDFIRTRKIALAVDKYKLKTLNIDHHPHPEKHPFTFNCVDLSAAATGCMVYDYLKIVREKPIEKKSLEGIYTAVMTDTGCFKYSNTNNKCHEIAIECLNSGVKTHIIYQNIYENSAKSRIRLMGEFLSNIHYELEGRLAWFVITQKMLIEAEATRSDVEGFSDMVRSINGVEVSIMIFEQSKTSCRINFRSKGTFIINDIAKKLGGGGHAFAAGTMVNGSLDEVKKSVVKESINSLKKKIEQIY